MQLQKKFEILNGLPPLGPMYIPISKDGIEFFHEGFVVRFFKSDGTNWIANFETGSTNYSTVFEIHETNKVIVVAFGQGYLMAPDREEPLGIFGGSISEIAATNDGKFVVADSTNLKIIGSDAAIRRSKRISLDGIKDLVVNEQMVSGLCFDPMQEYDQWVPFSFNLETGEIIGGSDSDDGVKDTKKPFWKFW